MSPRVTVLLAVHNGEPYVRDAIASVLEQTYTDFELLVVDDASTDETAATIESFDDPRIRLLRNEQNLGQVPSLNRGLREARGEIVARVDADDVMLAHRLERQLAVLAAEPRVALVGAWLELVDEHGRSVGALEERLDDRAQFVFQTLIMRVYVSHPAAMYRLAPVVEIGGYDEATGPAEDKDLWRKLLLGGWDARIVSERLVRYRLHEAQLSQTQAAYQRSIDGASQDRFLEALAPGRDVRAIRHALADEPELWEERRDPRELLAALDAVLVGARERLALKPDEAARVEALTAAWLPRVTHRRPWRPEARALASWSLARTPADRRAAVAAAHAASFPLAPLRLGVRRAVRSTGGVPGLRALRRSHAARRVYAKVAGGG